MKLAPALLFTATVLSTTVSPAFAGGAYILTGVPPTPAPIHADSGTGPHHYSSHHFGYSQHGGLSGDALAIGLVAVVLGLGIWFGRCRGCGKKE